MIDILDPPAERVLPARRAARMRADLITAVSRRPPTRSRRLRVAVAAAAVVALVAGAAALSARSPEGGRTLAMGPDELSPALRRAADQCLRWSAQGGPVPVSLTDLAVAAEQGHRTVVLFMTDRGYATCEVSTPPHTEISGAIVGRLWPQRDWLPGPVQRLLLTSSEPEGGDVAVSGRVAARVHRLVLDQGGGRTTTARLAGGAFGLLTDGADVRSHAELVSYDAGGREIGRQPLFHPSGELDHCYTDPGGTVVYGSAGPDCRPAERWRR